jgi:hypothetical protein
VGHKEFGSLLITNFTVAVNSTDCRAMWGSNATFLKDDSQNSDSVYMRSRVITMSLKD